MIYINDKTECLVFPQNGFFAASGEMRYVLYEASCSPVKKALEGLITDASCSPNLITWRPDEETMDALKELDQSAEYCFCLYDAEGGLPVSMTFTRVMTSGDIERQSDRAQGNQNQGNLNSDIIERENSRVV